MPDLVIRDCGPRDGLQPLAPVDTSLRAELVTRLLAAGVGQVEVASFVSPKAVPSMAGAADVVAALGADPRLWALVPNVRGAEMALGSGLRQLTVTVSASETYSSKNIQMSTAESLEEFARIRALGSDATLDVVVSCCFGSPFETIAPSFVAELVGTLREAGADQITLADTTGTATPARLSPVIDRVGTDVGLHLHDTRGTALTNAFAAHAMGIRRFDTCLGGLGGSPFAPGAGGNLATEDLVLLMEDLGISTGIDLDALLETGRWLAKTLGHPLPSRVSAAGRLDPAAP